MIGEGEEISQPLLYEGRGYKIYGPLSELIEGGGILVAESRELIDSLRANRQRLAAVINSPGLRIIDIIATPENHNPPQMIVGMPPVGYVNLATIQGDVAENVLKNERLKGFYSEDISAKDFWVNHATNELFFVALDKVKGEESG